jgi:hypothetical protein
MDFLEPVRDLVAGSTKKQYSPDSVCFNLFSAKPHKFGGEVLSYEHLLCHAFNRN